MKVLAAVPIKDLANAKQRLVSAFTPEQRRALARAMLADVLRALTAALPGSLLVVTKDPEVIEVARGHGAECLIERSNRGHTEAVALAQEEARARGASAFLTIPGDVPCVTPAEILMVCDGLDGRCGAAFVPSLSGFGTNAALLVPPHVIALKFGEPSFDNHLAAARAAGVTPRVLQLPGLGLDIDTPEDLPLLLQRGPRTQSAALLRGWDWPCPPVTR